MTKWLLCVLLFAPVAGAQLDQKTNKENMVHDRGQTPIRRETGTLSVTGMLFDAGCKDRSSLNLSTPAESLTAAMPVETTAESHAAAGAKNSGSAASAHGITVDAKTLTAERADIVLHQVPDLTTRQADPSCAVTGGTFGYAVRLDDGRILNLDEGGNTLAAEAVLASKDGRAMLNGAAYGFKPRVKMTGRVRGDRFMVEQIHTE
ncbi:MAG: hypothetical protein P4L56_01085 [Candidatus Sulfopaludibacter sp.]|nr:hypothetical protein [Candidatus Sulfopaludibacter sp.]